MATTLRVASEMMAYSLSDLATFLYLNNQTDLQLKILFGMKEEILYNPYSYIVVSPIIHDINYGLAIDFLRFARISRDLANNYKINNLTLFNPL